MGWSGSLGGQALKSAASSLVSSSGPLEGLGRTSSIAAPLFGGFDVA